MSNIKKMSKKEFVEHIKGQTANLIINLEGKETGLETKISKNGELGLVIFGLGVAVERLQKEYGVPYETIVKGIENGYQTSALSDIKNSEVNNA